MLVNQLVPTESAPQSHRHKLEQDMETVILKETAINSYKTETLGSFLYFHTCPKGTEQVSNNMITYIIASSNTSTFHGFSASTSLLLGGVVLRNFSRSGS
jgi:hypothetical protein